MLRTLFRVRLAIVFAALALVLPIESHGADGFAKFDRLPELLAEFDIGDAFFAEFKSGDPLSGSEIKLIARLLYRLNQTPQVDLDRWAHRGDDGNARLDRVNENRGELIAVTGRVTFVAPTSREADAGSTEPRYLCNFDTDDHRKIVIVVPRVPKAWSVGEAVSCPTSCQGVINKNTLQDDRETPLLATNHIAWYPPGLLSRLGMDVSLLDDLVDRKPIRGQERECFYQLLAAVNRAESRQLDDAVRRQLADLRSSLPGEVESASDPQQKAVLQHSLERANENQSDVVPLFNHPELQRGQLKRLEGIARRAIEVRVDDPEIVERFGIHHYYEVEMFTDDSQNNPITICTIELPDELSLGDDLYDRVRVAAVFFKTWSYPLGRVDSKGDRAAKSQLAPLLIARRVDWLSRSAPPSILSETIPLFILGLLSAGILVVVIRIMRSTQRTRRARLDQDDRARAALADLETHHSGRHTT